MTIFIFLVTILIRKKPHDHSSKIGHSLFHSFSLTRCFDCNACLLARPGLGHSQGNLACIAYLQARASKENCPTNQKLYLRMQKNISYVVLEEHRHKISHILISKSTCKLRFFFACGGVHTKITNFSNNSQRKMVQFCRFFPLLLGGGWFVHLAWKKVKAYN